jgi:hypothetical protein
VGHSWVEAVTVTHSDIITEVRGQNEGPIIIFCITESCQWRAQWGTAGSRL